MCSFHFDAYLDRYLHCWRGVRHADVDKMLDSGPGSGRNRCEAGYEVDRFKLGRFGTGPKCNANKLNDLTLPFTRFL